MECVIDRQSILWDVGAHSVRPLLLSIGEVVKIAIENIPLFYQNVTADKYVIMPNHIHLILRTHENGRTMCVPTYRRQPLPLDRGRLLHEGAFPMNSPPIPWTVLFLGGASGTGKSTLAYEIARFYGVNVLEADDVHLSVETVTAKDNFPAIHHWEGGRNWRDAGVGRNVDWLTEVSAELFPVLQALALRHIEDRLPVIIEGDFLHPGLIASLAHPEIKSLFLQETDGEQIIQNYLAREGGELQRFRAEISLAYGEWIAGVCRRAGVRLLEARPWDTVLRRAVEILEG